MKNKNDAHAEQPGKLLEDLHALVSEAEKLIGRSDPASSSLDLSALRDRIEASQQRLTELYACAKKQVVAGARCTDTTIREKPYQSLAMVAGVAFVVGLLLGRRKA